MLRKSLIAAALAAVGLGVGVANAGAAVTPPFQNCPGHASPAIDLCLNVQSTSGSLAIKDFSVNLGSSIRIEGGLRQNPDSSVTFVPPSNGSGNGFKAQPIPVPGGLLGIDLPIGLNMVNATAEKAGTIQVDPNTLSLVTPVKLHLTNPLLGPNCYIGSSSHPITLDLTTQTTSPPAPNTPISGHIGDFSFIPPGTNVFTNNLNVDNAFSVPGASGCLLGLGLVNTVVNLKLGLPSAAGRNTAIVHNDVSLAVPSDVGF